MPFMTMGGWPNSAPDRRNAGANPNASRGGFQPFTENAVGFAEGGAIPTEEDGMAMGPAKGLASAMAKATASVKEVLDYGRRKHGLIAGAGGDDEGAIPGAQASYQNNRMPMRPGSPSESGVPPVQPAPGPLPPTSNPFGKRAEAEPDNDEMGAIDTEEDVA
jgi:hypothetical protein